MKWTSEDVRLLGRNMVGINKGILFCPSAPLEDDLPALRANQANLTSLMEWLSIGEKYDAADLNKFSYVPEATGQSEIEDKKTAHRVKIDWTTPKLILQKENIFDECKLYKKQAGDSATVWMVYESGGGDLYDQITSLWIADWAYGKMYWCESRADAVRPDGDISKIASLITRLGGVAEALNWAKARAEYDGAYASSPLFFNPLA